MVAQIVAAAGLGALGSFFGGKSQEKAARKSADASLQGTREAIAAQERARAEQNQLQRPFRELGEQAVGQVSAELSTPISATDTFKFRQTQAEDALRRALAGQGKLGSGEAIKSALGLTERLVGAEEERRRALLGSAIGVGQQTVGLASQGAGQFGTNIGNLLLGQGGIQSQLQRDIGIGRSGLFRNIAETVSGAFGQSQIPATTITPSLRQEFSPALNLQIGRK